MPTFRYRGFETSGRPIHGFLDALDTKDAREKLAARGVLTEQVETAAGAVRSAGSARNRFNLSIRAGFYRELGSLTKAGLPLVAALELLLDSPEQEKQASLLALMRDRIREGQSLAKTLVEASDQVSTFERAAVEAGERSGRLDTALEQLADYLESQSRLRASLVSALLYPALVVVVALVVAIGLLGFVMPLLSETFTDTGTPLPLLTRALLAVSDGLPYYLGGLVALIAAVTLLGRHHWRTSSEFRLRCWRNLDRLPMYRGGSRTLVALRFARTLVVLMRGGVGAVDALDLAGQSTGNEWVADLVRQQAEHVRHGASLSQAIRSVGPLSGLGGWIKAGEASGDLIGLLDKGASRLEQRWQTYLARAVSLLEPVLILLVGVFVLVIALAILLPVLSLNQTVL